MRVEWLNANDDDVNDGGVVGGGGGYGCGCGVVGGTNEAITRDSSESDGASKQASASASIANAEFL